MFRKKTQELHTPKLVLEFFFKKCCVGYFIFPFLFNLNFILKSKLIYYVYLESEKDPRACFNAQQLVSGSNNLCCRPQRIWPRESEVKAEK